MATIERTTYGTYRVRWRDQQGRTQSKTLKTKTEAKYEKAQIESDLHRGTYTDPAQGKTRLDAWITQWHQSRLSLRPTTRVRDDSYIRNYITPNLGHHQLRNLTPQHIRDWISTIAINYSPATVTKAHALLKAALQRAVDDGLLPTNPCHGTPLPRHVRPNHRYLTIDEVNSLANSIQPRYRAMILTMALTGLRPGEIAGLHIGDIDFLKHTLTVKRTATESSGHLAYDEPKTPAARRTITISRTLVELLASHIATYGTADPFLFSTSNEKPIRWKNLRRRQFRAAVQASVGQPCVPHDLRHTHAALCIAQNIHPKVLQARLGHSSISITMDTYGGLFSGFDTQVANALDEAFSSEPMSEMRQLEPSDLAVLPHT